MKVIIKDKIINCPICQNNDFYIAKEVKIHALRREYGDESAYNIIKDELQCTNCGWTGYFENEYEYNVEKECGGYKITYENQ